MMRIGVFTILLCWNPGAYAKQLVQWDYLGAADMAIPRIYDSRFRNLGHYGWGWCSLFDIQVKKISPAMYSVESCHFKTPKLVSPKKHLAYWTIKGPHNWSWKFDFQGHWIGLVYKGKKLEVIQKKQKYEIHHMGKIIFQAKTKNQFIVESSGLKTKKFKYFKGKYQSNIY